MTTGNDTERKGTRFRLSQETIAIVTVGIALAGLNLATVGDLREEARADRAAAQAAAQADRAAWQTEAGSFATRPAPTAKTSSARWKRCSVRWSG